MQRLFGTDGIRGIANIELTPELAFRVGKVLSYVLGDDIEDPKIVVGRDTRLSGEMLESALIAGILSSGADVIKLGVVTTPGVAFAAKHVGAIGGVMISASHNLFSDNGLKFFSGSGYKLNCAYEKKIEELLHQVDELPKPSGDELGCILDDDEIIDEYLQHLKSTVETDLCGMHIVVDCANGSAHRLAPALLRDLGADVTSINSNPTGTNINDKCGSVYPQKLCTEVLNKQAHLGIAFDGDADRLVAVDESGKLIDGDQILYVCAEYLQQRGLLNADTVVTTVMSNLGLFRALDAAGIKYEQTDVGDRYVADRMIEKEYTLGGEQSGHTLFLSHSTTGDGLLTAVQLLSIVKETGQTLQQLAERVVKYPQILRNITINNKDKFNNNKEISNIVAKITGLLGDSGRLLVRPSGTEKLIRIMLEGEDKAILATYADEIAAVIEQQLN